MKYKCSIYLFFLLIGVLFPDNSSNLQAIRPFITIWKSDAENTPAPKAIILPVYGAFNYRCELIDDPRTYVFGEGSGYTVIQLPKPGTYRVILQPRGRYNPIHRIHFGMSYFEAVNRKKLIGIEQWGDIEWSSFKFAFGSLTNTDDEIPSANGTSNLVITATDIPDLSRVTDMSGAFAGCRFGENKIPRIEEWDVRKVKTMERILKNASSFNANLGYWALEVVQEIGLENCGMNCGYYSLSLEGWARNTITNANVKVKADNLRFNTTINEASREKLVSLLNWEIQGDIESYCYGPRPPFNIYPNPADNYLIFDGMDGGEEVQIIDINAQTVDAFETKLGKNTIDIKGLPSGLYFLKIKDADDEIRFEKVIIH